MKQNLGDKIKVLIEICGQGGYVVVLLLKGYKKYIGDVILMIIFEQWDILLEFVWFYNEVVELLKWEYIVLNI